MPQHSDIKIVPDCCSFFCPLNFKKILICTKVVEERVAVLIQGYNDRVLERGQIRKSPGVD